MGTEFIQLYSSQGEGESDAPVGFILYHLSWKLCTPPVHDFWPFTLTIFDYSFKAEKGDTLF